MFKIACMKKIFLLYFGILAAVFSFTYLSCKKITHPTNPTPANYRLLSYTKVLTQTIIAPPTLTPVITGNYRFVYDGNNRVSQIFFTSNDSNEVKAGLSNLSIVFNYKGDSIYKTTTDLSTSNIRERDTFIQNPQGQITNAYFPNEVHNFSYYGKLLATENVIFRDTNTTLSINMTYTSYNGDFLNRLFDGNLAVHFPDTGIKPYIAPGDTVRDTVLSLPLNITWTTFFPNSTTSTATHSGINGYSDGMSGFFQNSIIVTAIDPNGVTPRPIIFPAGYCSKQSYLVNDQLGNSTGDYLQLGSFTTYGVNIYQNVHLVKTIISPYNSINIDYTIDADSKITNTSVVIRDSVLKNIVTEQYKLQYETY